MYMIAQFMSFYKPGVTAYHQSWLAPQAPLVEANLRRLLSGKQVEQSVEDPNQKDMVR